MKILTNFPKEPPDSFPVKAARGTSVVTIYHKERTKGTVLYHEFSIPYAQAGKRRFHSFPSYDKVREKGNAMLDSGVTGDTTAVTLKEEDKMIYNRAQGFLRPVGVALDRAAEDYAFYWQRMGGNHFKEAVEQFIVRRDTIKSITLPALVTQFIEQKTSSTKRSRPASPDYVKDLQARLGRFSDTYAGPVANLTPDTVLVFLDGLKMSARTRFNYARLLRTLFRFAQAKRYLAKDVDLMEGIDISFEDDGEIEIFSTAELQRILSGARHELVPFLAIGAFAGLRHAEITRLDWQEVDLERGFIEVKAAKAKTRSRRLVPISANLRAWLTPYANKKSGNVAHYKNCSKQLMWLVKGVNEASEGTDAPKLEWKHNAMRHSFISYRLAQIQHADQVALEAGNSPQMIFGHYRELVRPEDAKAWFSIMPAPSAQT
ncbi:MAG TPA: tyrosine-type recombinase/integrase [Verrucomicrobiae bacterium]|jgi:integrase|nr:tyrosine-type recombinase/integrase [Verrucomicrobiae bacterium]